MNLEFINRVYDKPGLKNLSLIQKFVSVISVCSVVNFSFITNSSKFN